jgi:hypothetical protein
MRKLYYFLFALVLAACGPTVPPEPPDAIDHLRSCSVLDPSITLVITYDEMAFVDGTVAITCAVSDSATTSSNTEFYLPGMSGAETGNCFVVHDAAGAFNRGFWLFNRNSVAYHDAVDVPAGATFLLSCATTKHP